ncbi:MAG: DUF1420 family protein [Desulfobaccales bacterium]
MTPFLKLEDFLAPAPLPAIIAVLMPLGLKFLGSRLVRKLHVEPPRGIQEAAGFILVAAILAATAHFLAVIGAANLWLLRIMAWSLLAFGIVELSNYNRERLLRVYQRLKEVFQAQSFWGKAAISLLIFTGVCLFLSALGPPTDDDSLAYHLGVPLDILRHHGIYARPDWLVMRLTGLGESLNMLGLAGGTDVLGAALQYAGIIAILVAINSLAKTHLDSILLFVCIIGCPVVGFLVQTQKPQMLPVAATAIAIILIAQNFRSIDPTTLILALGSIFFAISVKYNFMLTGGIIWILGMMAAYRARLLAKAIGISLLFYLILVFPVHLQHLLDYGDPISPFLERFKSPGDPVVLKFASALRHWSPKSQLPFPLNIFIPTYIGSFTEVLGLGVLLFFVDLREAREHLVPRIFLICTVIAIICTLALSQLTGRFFFEIYLWIIAAAAAAAWRPLKTGLFKLMVCQLAFMAVMAGFAAVTLFPGALTASLRDKVMMRSAYSFAETRWLDAVLPQNAVVLTPIRSMALMPRPSLSGDIFGLYDLRQPNERQRFKRIIRANHVNTLVIPLSLPDYVRDILAPGITGSLAGPKEFQVAVRNPWNKSKGRKFMAYHFNPEKVSPVSKVSSP